MLSWKVAITGFAVGTFVAVGRWMLQGNLTKHHLIIPGANIKFYGRNGTCLEILYGNVTHTYVVNNGYHSNSYITDKNIGNKIQIKATKVHALKITNVACPIEIYSDEYPTPSCW